MFLEMRRGNPAINLYQKVGFEPIGERPNYYRLANGERADAITFGRSI
jgi:ribosomal-protein-alanine N-acetyltransferase